MVRAIALAGLTACGFHGQTVLASDGALTGDAPASDAQATTDALPPCLLPAADWEFEEVAGLESADSAGTHTLALTNASWTTGHASHGALLFGGSGYAQTPYVASLAVTTAVTITAWIAPTSTTGHGGLVVKGDRAGTVQDWGFYHEGTELGALFDWPSESSTIETSSGAGLVSGQWDFVAFVLDTDAATLSYYKAGVLVSTIAAPATPLLQNPAPITIGVDAGTPSFYSGAIDSVMLWTRALGPTEIATLYTGACLR